MMEPVESEIAAEIGMPKNDNTPLDVDLHAMYNAVALRLGRCASLNTGDIRKWHLGLELKQPKSDLILSRKGAHFGTIGPDDVLVKYVFMRLKGRRRVFFEPRTGQLSERKPRGFRMSLAEFMDVDVETEPEGTTDLFKRSVIEATQTITQNFDCSKKEAEAYAEDFTQSLQDEGRLTEDFVTSEPYYWKVLHDFTQ